MADDTLNQTESQGPESDGTDNVATLDALHLDGKGLDGLDDAQEQELTNTDEVEGEDVKAFANVQSAGRETFEKMVAGAPAEEGAIPVGDQVVPEPYVPSEPDNLVDAQFSNPFPAFAPEAEAEADDEARPAADAAPREEARETEPRPPADPEVGDDDPAPAPAEASPTEAVLPVELLPVDDVIEISEGMAQAPTLTLETVASGTEDQLTQLKFAVSTNDTDSSGDVFSRIEISGVPADFEIVDSAGNPIGIRLGDTWVLDNPTTQDLADIYLKNVDSDDDADFSGDFTLRVTATASDPASTASTSLDVPVHIEAVADTPVIAVGDTHAMENQWQDLDITLTSKDQDGSEYQQVYVTGLPDGAQLNHGTVLTSPVVVDGITIPAGSVLVDGADIADLKVLPPSNDSHDFTLTVRGLSTETMNGDRALSDPLTIEVDVGIVAPAASGDGIGNEDDWALLDLNASINLPDGTEVLTVALSDLPADAQLATRDGAALIPDGDGNYAIALADLDNLKVRWTDPQHTDADITFNLTATVRDGDTDTDSATIQAGAPDVNAVTVPVTAIIRAVADAPTLSASAIGVEDQWHALTINSALVDADGSESLSVTVTGPAGFSLNVGTETSPGSGSWTLTPDQLTGLQFKPPLDSDSDFNLTITATTTEAATGDQVAVKTASSTSTITVKVLSDADLPTVAVDEPAKHVAEDGFYNLRTVLEDGGYAVTGHLGELGADDGETASPDSSESLTFQIDPVEAIGLRLQTLDSGTGTWSDLAPSGGVWTVSAAQVFNGQVRVGGPADWASSNNADAIHFDIRTIATEANDATDDALQAANPGLSRDGQATSAWDQLTLVIDPVADTATLVDTNAGPEDQVGGITIDPVATFTDTDFSERPDPDGTVTIVSSDIDMTSGHFELTLDGITTTITPAIGGDGAYTWAIPGSAFVQSGGDANQWTLAGLKFFPATHLAEDATYTVNMPAYDTQTGVSRVLTATGSVTVDAVADIPDLAAGRTYGMENTAIAVDISASLVDLDGSETQWVYVADFPAGAVFNHGTVTTQAITVDGITIPAGALKVAPADLDSLTVTPPANYSDDMTFRVWSTTAETRNGDMAINGPVTAMVDVGIVDPSAAGSGSGTEGLWTTLNLSANVNAADGNESLRVFIEDLPSGAELARVDTGASFTQVTYTGSDGLSHTGYEVTGNLANVKVRWTDTNADADMALNLRAIATDRDADPAADSGGIDRATAITDTVSPDSADILVPVAVTIKADTDSPTLQASAIGVEDKWVALNIVTALQDTDGSETLDVYVSNLPDGATLSAGTYLADGETLINGSTIPAGSWKLSPDQLSDLKIANLPTDSDTDFTITVRSVATETATGDQVASRVAIAQSTFNATVFGDADKPVTWVDPDTQVIREDTMFQLRSVLPGYDPATAKSGEAGGAFGTSAATAVSADGSETVTLFRITPTETGTRLAISADSTISAGEYQALPASGYWEVPSADVFAGKVYVGGKANWSAASDGDTIHFDVRTVVREGDYAANTGLLSGTGLSRLTENVSDPATLTLQITPVADAPTLTASGVGVEDKWAALTISTALTDTDGSESIAAIYISGLPVGSSLSAGTLLTADETLADGTTVIPAGTWKLATGELSGLKITNLPTDSDADFAITVKSVAVENAAGTPESAKIAVTTTNATVTVFGDADKPTVRVDADTQIINEDTMFQLRSVLGGYDPVTGTLGEAASQLATSAATAVSADGSESLTLFRIYPTETGTRLAISPDTTIATGEYVALPASGYWEVSAADVFAGKVYVGGKANWSSATDGDTIHFDIRTVAREGDYAANTASLTGTGLTRATQTVSDPMTLTLKVTPVADSTTVGTLSAGNEDVAIAFNPKFTLNDQDGSEHLAGTVDILIPKATAHGQLTDASGAALSFTDDGTNYVYSFPVGSLTTTKTVSGVPVEFRLDGVKFDNIEHSDRDLTYKIRVTSEDTGGTQNTYTTPNQTLAVKAVADAPIVAVGNAVDGVVTGTEDTRVELDLSALRVDLDGSETLSKAELWSVDDGWEIGYVNGAGQYSAATSLGGGKWQLDTAKLDQVVVTPPDDTHHLSAANVQMEFHAWTLEAATGSQLAVAEATSQVSFQVVVNADADTPTLQLSHARVDEDARVKLEIKAALTDTDGSETLGYFISNLPDGGTLQTAAGGLAGTLVSFDGNNQPYADANGTTWMLTPAQIGNVYFTPKHDSNVDGNITVTARSTEGSNLDIAENTQTLRVIVKGISDGPEIPAEHLLTDGSGQPVLDANGRQILSATGIEDKVTDPDGTASGTSSGALIDPGFGDYGTLDIDNSETLSIVIKNVPADISIEMANGGESYLKYIGGDKWSVDPAHLGDVRFRAPADFAGTFDVKLDLITTEDDGHSLGQERTLRVAVDADADTPRGSIGASVTEDSWRSGATDNGIAISVSASVADTTGGVEHVSALVIDLDTSLLGGIDPAGISLTFGGQTYTAVNGHITISLSEAPGAGQLDLGSHFTDNTANGLANDSGSLSAMRLYGVPADWSNDIPIKLTVTGTDVDGSTATRVVNGKVAIAPDVDQPTFTVDDSTISAYPGEVVDLAADAGANLTFGLNDDDLSEAASYFMVTGVPQGMTLSWGINAGEGTWILPASAGTFPPTVSTDYTGTATLNFYAVVKDTDAEGHVDTDRFGPVAVTLTVAADGAHAGSGPWPTTPPATIGAPDIAGTLATPEDTAFNLGGLTVTADDPATETISGLVVTDVPAGASVAGGYYNFLTGDWVVPAGSAASLSITPPDDFSGTMAIGLRAVAVKDGLYAVTETAALPVAVSPVTDGASFGLSVNGGGAIIEDMGDIPLSISLAELDADFSESLVDGVLTIRLTGGAGQLVDASGTPLTPVSANTYQVNIADFAVDGSTDLTGLSFRPPAQYSGSVSLAFSINVSDQGAAAATATGSLTFSVQADADAPIVHANAVSGNEDTAIALDIMLDGQDLVGANAYGSEGISVVVGNVPAGALIQGAFNNNDGTWTVKGANISLVNDPTHGWVAKLTGVSFLPGQDDSSDWSLTVTAYTSENGVKNEIASASGSFTVTVNGIADQPTIDPQAAAGSEDVELALNLNAQLIDLSEGLSVTIGNVPVGATFTDGAGHAVGTPVSDGVWTFESADLGSLHFKGPLNASGTWTMSAFATSTDDASTAVSVTKSFSVTLTGVADLPTVTITDLTPPAAGNQASGNEDTATALSFAAALTDTDGSETLAVTITGAPAGTKFLAVDGTQIVESSGGKWIIDAADIAGLKMVPPANWSGDAVLTITATATEAATEQSASSQLTVHIDAINDAPDVSLFTVAQGISGTATTNPIHVLPGPDTIQVTDVDGAALTGMTVKISDGWEMGDSLGVSGLDLGFNAQGALVVEGTGITVAYDGANHALVFSGDGSYADYGAIAATVVLTNDTGTIDPGARTFDVTIFDEAGAQDTVQTTASIGANGATDPIVLQGDALGDIRWNSTGEVVNGDTLFISPEDGGATFNGSAGLDMLTVRHDDGSSGDWLLQVDQNDPTIITATSDSDQDFVVHLDPGSGPAAIDAHGDLVFNGDASGRIEFEDHHTVEFNHLEKLGA